MSANKNSGWKLRGNYDIKPGVASFPENSADRLSRPNFKYALLNTREKEGTFAVEVREGAQGSIIFVYPGALNASIGTDIDCNVKPKTHFQHRGHLLLRTSQGRLALLGFFLGVSGIFIDGSLKAGAAMQQPLIVINTTTHASLLIAATILQVIGLLLVFIRAVRRSDF